MVILWFRGKRVKASSAMNMLITYALRVTSTGYAAGCILAVVSFHVPYWDKFSRGFNFARINFHEDLILRIANFIFREDIISRICPDQKFSRKKTELTRLLYLIVENNFLYGQKVIFKAVLVPKKESFQLKRGLRER